MNKAISAIILTAVLAVLTAVMMACSKPNAEKHAKENFTEISVLKDITDPFLAQPSILDISRLLRFEKEKWSGAIVRFSELSDVSYTPVKEVSIEAENEWLSNEIKRKKKMEKFQGGINGIFQGMDKQSTSKNFSSIYLPIARELNRLSQSNAEKRILLVYSDLIENQKELSFYNDKTVNLLKTKPEDIRQFLEKQQPLADLHGIEVHFIYQPADNEADSKFRTVSEFYKNLLENKGAKVFVRAN